jgi:ribosomal protein L11 methyltransferase
MPHPFVELMIGSDPAAFDEFIGVLIGEGFEGFWEDGETLKAYIPGNSWTDMLRETVATRIGGVAGAHGLPSPLISESVMNGKNWNAEWEAGIRPIRVSETMVIAPTWNRHDPTGYHETTRLMLRLVERYVRQGDNALDVGTGTGVLAIAALKLGAATAIAVDVDEDALDNARENASLNGVAGRLAIRSGGLPAVGESAFTLIMVNIQRTVIEAMLPTLVSRLGDTGVFLLSGLLQSDRDAITGALAARRLAVIEEIHEGEWLAFAATKAT